MRAIGLWGLLMAIRCGEPPPTGEDRSGPVGTPRQASGSLPGAAAFETSAAPDPVPACDPSAGQPPQDSAVSPKQRAVIATLARTRCYGSCPAYRLTIYEDGLVEYVGEDFVTLVGKQTARLDAASIVEIHQAFAQAKYLQLKGRYDCREWTCNPSAITSYRHGEFVRTIKHYYGCRGEHGDAGCRTSPQELEALTALEARIDKIVQVDRWVGSSEERRKKQQERWRKRR